MKKYFDWGKTDLWGFMRFLDTMKIHGIIENDCEDFIAIWRTNVELARHRAIWWLSICPSITNARTRRSRPSSRQKVTMGGHFPSCFTKYSQESDQIYIYEALPIPESYAVKFWRKKSQYWARIVPCAGSSQTNVVENNIFMTKKDESYCEGHS